MKPDIMATVNKDKFCLNVVFKDGTVMIFKSYEERKVARDVINGFTIDTVLVTDRSWKYETAIAHDDFNDGHWIIVEGYDSKENAVQMIFRNLQIVTHMRHILRRKNK